MIRGLGLVVFGVGLGLGHGAALAREGPPADVRLAFVSHGLTTRHKEFARAYEPALGEGVRIRVALGSYPDVVGWISREQVDLAFLPAVAYAAVKDDPHLRTVTATEQVTPFGTDTPRARRHYLSVAVARAGPGAPARAEDADGCVAVDPLSASGFLAPMAALQEDRRRRPRLAFGHARALDRLEPGRVAFVQEDALERRDDRDRFVRLPFAELDRTPIPGEALVATVTFLARSGDGDADRGLARLRAVLGVGVPPRTDAERRALEGLGFSGLSLPDPDEYDAFVKPRLRAVFGRDTLRPQDLRYSAGDLVSLIEARRGPEDRVALVLSGGGNKCAFEAGVLAELYDHGFRPDVIVGTSGGALNALATAVGLSSESTADLEKYDSKGRTRLERLWLDLREEDVIPRRSALVALVLSILGVAFVAVVALVQTLLLRGRWLLGPDGRLVPASPSAKAAPRAPVLRAGAWLLAGGFVALAGFGAAALALEISWGPLGVVRHGLLAFGLLAALRFAALAIAAGDVGPGSYNARAGGRGVVRPARDAARRAALFALKPAVRAAFALVAILALAGAVVFIHRSSELVPTSGVRDLLERQVGPRVRDLDRKPLEADLILTVTPFGGEALAPAAPGSLPPLADPTLRAHYKWFPRDPAALRPDDPRLRFFEPLPAEHLIDVATASAALFPVFGLHPIAIGGRRGLYIDGGYGHNIPVQAARLWGATFIVVVRASPDAPPAETGNALGNVLNAVNVLFERAQRLDDPRGQEVHVFQVSPRATYDILTFRRDDLARAIADGRAAARAPSFAGPDGFVEMAAEVPTFDP